MMLETILLASGAAWVALGAFVVWYGRGSSWPEDRPGDPPAMDLAVVFAPITAFFILLAIAVRTLQPVKSPGRRWAGNVGYAPPSKPGPAKIPRGRMKPTEREARDSLSELRGFGRK